MATVLHRTTKQYLPSANTPDYPLVDWIHNPDLAAVVGFDSRYWIITGDVVTLMSPAERDALDASLVEATRDALAAQLQDQEDLLRAFMLIMLDEINRHSQRTNTLLSAIDAAASLAALKTAVASIADLPEYTEQQLRTAVRNRLGS